MGLPGIELTHLGSVVQDVLHYTTEQLGNLTVFCHCISYFTCVRVRAHERRIASRCYLLPSGCLVHRPPSTSKATAWDLDSPEC